jgi:DNA helicase HerA-like ATPase
MKKFLNDAALQHNPLRVLVDFMKSEDQKETSKKYSDWRFVGYVLDIGYDTTTIITSDPFKRAVGGIPRNSLLIMVPSNFEEFPPHFTLLRVLETAPTPLSREVQQTYFELQKNSMPELDIFTQSELQWGALKTAVLGMFYPHPEDQNKLEFSGDLNNFVSAHKYRVFSPNDVLLDLITNSLVPETNRFPIGKLRLTECRLPLPGSKLPEVNVNVSTNDFMGTRTAMFGKTRLGKSNVVKIIAQSLIETTKVTKNVGQIIFDINGEYANDNIQDGSTSLASAYKDNCQVYALSKKENTPSKPLKLDFYESPDASHKIIAALLKEAGKDTANYISSFLSVEIPSFELLNQLPENDKKRAKRKILMYWAILHRAGFPTDLKKLYSLLPLDPGFNKDVKGLIYDDKNKAPTKYTLESLSEEFELLAAKNRLSKLKSSTNNDLFDTNDVAILGFLVPESKASTGAKIIQQFKKYHDENAGNFVSEILELTDGGMTAILDLGNAPPEVMNYFSQYLTRALFHHQVEKFSNNLLKNHYIQLYFEEAHNLFPSKESEFTDIYSRIAKEGAKYNMGMVYSTQSPSTISGELLAQTENFFVAHISSRGEVKKLASLNVAYENIQEDILQAKTPGYLRILTRSHRFVVPVQASKFSPTTSPSSGGT